MAENENLLGFIELKPKELIITVHGMKEVIPMNRFVSDDVTMQTHQTKDIVLTGGTGEKKWKLIIQSASGYLGSSADGRRITAVSGVLLF